MSCLNLSIIVSFQSIESSLPLLLPTFHPLPFKMFPDIVLVLAYLILF